MTELADLTIAELLNVYRSHEASPTEAVESCLGRIERVDPSVNAVLTWLVDRSVSQAAGCTKRWQNGEARALEGSVREYWSATTTAYMAPACPPSSRP